MDLITTTDELAAVCSRMARHPFVTVDTEFLRETTYYPLLCVAQMASPAEAVVIDALATGIDLAPFFALMANEKIVKVFHAARQDIEIVWNMAKTIPHPIFDSQVARVVEQRHLRAAAVAVARLEAGQQGGEMVVQAARHHALALAQRTGHAELGRDRLADKSALVRQLVEQLRQLFLDQGRPLRENRVRAAREAFE
jgi:hypothetical protein